MKLPQLAREQKRAAKKGVPLVDWIAAKQPRALFPSLVDELIQVCEAVECKIDQLRGGSNFYKPDREYRELLKRKLALMQAAKLASAGSM